MPSHLTFQQTRNFMGALAKGDPEAGAAILQTARELVGSILPDKDGGLSAAYFFFFVFSNKELKGPKNFFLGGGGGGGGGGGVLKKRGN